MTRSVAPRLRVRPGARAEIREARRWYEGESRGLERAFVAEVDAALAFALRHPELYEVFEAGEPAVRRALLHRFPYALVYEVVPPEAPRELVVLACFHHRHAGYYPDPVLLSDRGRELHRVGPRLVRMGAGAFATARVSYAFAARA